MKVLKWNPLYEFFLSKYILQLQKQQELHNPFGLHSSLTCMLYFCNFYASQEKKMDRTPANFF